MAELLEHSRQRRHGGTADADQVNVFWRHGRLRPCWTPQPLRFLHGSLITQRHPVRCRQLGVHAEGQGQRAAGNVAGLHSKYDWNFDVVKNPHDDLLQRVIQRARFAAVDHLAEDDAAHAIELPRQLQLHQHAIDSIRPLGAIFDEQDRVPPCESRRACPATRRAATGSRRTELLRPCLALEPELQPG